MNGGVTPSRVVTLAPGGGSAGGGAVIGGADGLVAHADSAAARPNAASAPRDFAIGEVVLGAHAGAGDDLVELMTRPSNDPPVEAPREPSCPRPSSPPLERGLAPGLYVVATPIGNLRDITLRALDVLAAVDVIYAEDTRVTRKLLDAYGLRTQLMSYHEHNAEAARADILAALASGARVALVSDAGTPLISDPGHKLARAVIAAGHALTPIPGASAALAALVVAGLPTDRFLFAGFAPAKAGPRRAMFAELAEVRATLVFYETAPRLTESLADMAEIFGARDGAVARELTKLYEEVRRAPLPELAAHYREHGPPKGEIVVLIAPPLDAEAPSDDALDDALRTALARGQSVKEAAALVAAALGVPRKRAYARALDLRNTAP